MNYDVWAIKNLMIHSSCNQDSPFLPWIVNPIKILEALSGQNSLNCRKTQQPILRSIKVIADYSFRGKIGKSIIMWPVFEGLPLENDHVRTICKRSKGSERIRYAMNKSKAKTKVKTVKRRELIGINILNVKAQRQLWR